MNELLITLTTISSRLQKVDHVIESLLKQDFKSCPFSVSLHLSREPYLLDEGCPELTPRLNNLREKYPETFFVKYVENTGPYRKIIPILNNLYGLSSDGFSKKLIVTADDDSLYPSDWLQKLYDSYKEYNCIVGYRGRVMSFQDNKLLPYQNWEKTVISKSSIFNLPTGKDGVLYSPFFLHPAVCDIDKAVKYAPKADDLWLKVHSLLNGVENVILNDHLSAEFPSVSTGKDEISLYNNFNKRGGNDEALENLNIYLELEHDTNIAKLCHNREEIETIAIKSLLKFAET